MAKEHRFLAMDFGAESGRGIIVTLADGRADMEEIHRFPNRRVEMAGVMYWDFPFLYAEMLEAIRICAARGVALDGISVDTWGVDFGLLDKRGELLGFPVSYRDGRTEGIHEYSEKVMSKDEIFRATAGETWAISSLFQLLSMRRDKSPLLKAADTFLNLPNLFLYLLTGKKVNERTIVSTAALMGTDGQWSQEVIKKFNLPPIFGDLVEPGTVLGPLLPSIREQVGLDDAPVIASCGHDTSAVVAAVPGEGENWAFLSCGTWSVLGALVDTPIISPRTLELGFCNEYTYGSWYACNHILGLWLVQELHRKWDTTSDPWDYNRITSEAAQAKYEGLLNVADESLLSPVDMESSLGEVLAKGSQPPPKTRGELVRGVLASLALEYASQLAAVSELAERTISPLYMVGGGIANKLLCQLTANACGVPVHAGPAQCTALGNALVQAAAIGVLSGADEIRQVMRNSTDIAIYNPQDQNLWREKRKQYDELKK